ncbi:EAL domain-containing protein [Massilia endophytica]|uniref:EAL domain-containing protein n=1 Tax=Massilia endophytica TaxID=2899220 RepID=UPI001E488977|nr:EAL domain-containing protein [Massilia endophytica]UGQ48760.1 EAL domain-containing protein [Massilia endophytica]
MPTQYHILERVGATTGSYLHRGRRVLDGSPVLLKLLASEEIAVEAERFRREYAIFQGLDAPGVAKPRLLIDEPGRLLMVLDPVQGELFESVLERHKFDLPACLRLAMQLAQVLGALHAAHIVDHDFRPANLMLLPGERLLLMDLSLASSESVPAATPEQPRIGDWAYISPEHTGRMSRAIDYRADYYSLGITLYRMLTGRLPCQGNDPLEWMHCHLASVPEPPSDIDPAIPAVLSAIVLKLLQKMPEDRYQSLQGLHADLEQCLRQWEADGSVAPFPLGLKDTSDRLEMPHRLIGREEELQQLLASHGAVLASGRPGLALVSGGAGVGKSTLVEALHQPILERHGFFISGKFDRYQREVPYCTVTQAFEALVEQLLAGSEEELASWRTQILAAVGDNGQLIVDVLPQMELVIGPQKPLLQVPPFEAQNRFRLVFLRFIGVFAQEAHPLTLFLDNLDAADAGTLHLLKDLMNAPGQSWLQVVGAYRDDEVGPVHPLAMTLSWMRKEGVPLTEISLAPLAEPEAGLLIGEMLHCGPDAAAPLVRVVYEKTGGNPFFVGQFVFALAEEGLIAVDPRTRIWHWDLERIAAKGYTDNVAELMVEKLSRLSGTARTLLQLLACLGSETQAATLISLSGLPEGEAQAALGSAVRAGLVFRTGGKLKFLHDRVQEAAYLSLPEAERAALHLQIGRSLMAGGADARETLFAIADQFNRGAAAIADDSGRTLLRQLNFRAGMRAKASVALDSARSFLNRSMELLPADAWEKEYGDTLELFLALSECESLAGHFKRADELANQVLGHARSRRDSARLYMLRIALNQMAGRLDDSVESMAVGARLFGETFPAEDEAVEAAIEAEIQEIAHLLEGRRIADIAEAPPLADPDVAALLALLAEGIPAAYMVKPDYFSLMVARGVRLSLQHGNTEDSSFAYSAYGILLSRRSDIRSSLEFSRMAMKLHEQLGGRRRKGHIIATHAIAYGFYSHAVSEIRPMLEEGFAASLDVGDLVYASYVTMTYFWAMVQEGVPLDEVGARAARECEFARDSHNDTVFQTIRFEQQLVASLKGLTSSPGSMDDADFKEAACIAALEKASFGFGLQSSFIIKQMASFIYGDYAGAMAAGRQAAHYEHSSGSLILFDAPHHFFLGLAAAALYPQAAEAERREYAEVLAQERSRHQLWADACPANFGDRLALLEAETARIEGRHDEAAGLYELAIRSASENGFIQNAAIALELASGFYRGRGFELIADTYLREARAAYARWGADGKTAQIDAAHPHLLAQAAVAPAGVERDATRLDLLSIGKAAQAISGQLVLTELVDTLMHIVLENAGAQTGYLVLVRGDKLRLAADATLDRSTVQVNVHMERALPPGLLPASVLNYVRRRRVQVLLPDAAQPNAFSRDPYFANRQPKSVLCLPVLREDVLIGMLYLESGLVTHAFAPERVSVLQLLSSRAAISLENARLYSELQERESRIRRLFESNIVGIMFYDLNGRITGANDAALDIIGYSRADLDAGKVSCTGMTPPEWKPADERAVAELRRSGTCRPYEKEYLRKDGSRVPVLTAAAMFDGASEQGVSFAVDLSERKRAEDQMRHMANHDALTGLPNRTLLQDRLEQAISYAHRNQYRVAILFVDLDHFKYINDSLGHQFGDAILRMAAERLQNCVREGDSVARLGGDEFVICLPALTEEDDVAGVAKSVLDALIQPYHIDGHELHAGCSIGISLYPDDATDVETLMRTADTAMYHAKEKGRGNFQFFTEGLNLVAQQRLEVGRRLRQALLHDEFILHYQPQVQMESGRIFAAEALLRWRRAGHAPISCGSFIANAEESGLIVPIGEWALRQACRQLQSWRDAGHANLKVAVNLSPRQLEAAGFCTMVGQILDEAGLPADALELEITEGLFLRNSEATLATLSRLRDMGVKLSVDDFGTGYSSLAYLQRFPVHALKIDQSFVRDIGTDRNHRALITAIIAMADSLELGVMAEGVETGEQVSFLLAHGCHCAQGFYYSKAVPAQRFSDLLDSSFAER